MPKQLVAYERMEKKMSEDFDTLLLKKFRETINSTNIFYEMPKYRHYWNLICVIMDRLDSAASYLNQHSSLPNSEEELIFYLVFADILKKGIYSFHEQIYKNVPPTANTKKWFKNATYYSTPLFDETNCPTDDEFFDYFRALAFAHPFDTSRKKSRLFMKKGEIQCSPWVSVHNLLDPLKDSVGLRMYSSHTDEIRGIHISFQNLKNYLKERFCLLKDFIKWSREAIIDQSNEWKETKVNRAGTELNILTNIKSILESRFIDSYSIDIAIDFFESKFKQNKNIEAIEFVKNIIKEALPSLCDCVDELDYEHMEELLNFLYERPNNLHEHAHYELEKIFEYLGEEKGLCLPGSNEEWGLIQAKHFYEAYAKRFVVINFDTMNYLEIKTLIRSSLIVGSYIKNK